MLLEPKAKAFCVCDVFRVFSLFLLHLNVVYGESYFLCICFCVIEINKYNNQKNTNKNIHFTLVFFVICNVALLCRM